MYEDRLNRIQNECFGVRIVEPGGMLRPWASEESVKPEKTRWWLPFLLLISCSSALAQTIALSDGTKYLSEDSTFMTNWEGAASPLQSGSDSPSSGQSLPKPEKSAPKQYGWHIAIYPALAWVPVFGTSVTLPSLPSQPITTPGPSGSTDSGLNGAFFGGARFEKSKWSVDALFMWAALSAQRQTPFTKVNLDFVFGDIRGGREVFRGFYLEGGVRRLALDVHATVGSASASRSPGFWDPLIGLSYRRQLGNKWRILIHGDGGGFGAGSDVDITATARAEWQFVRHVGLTMGYGGMHLSKSDTIAGRTLKLSPTLHGPIFGLGVFF